VISGALGELVCGGRLLREGPVEAQPVADHH
jgi:hypothetical protein